MDPNLWVLMQGFFSVLIVGLFRATLGWLENAFEDGKITLMEWRMLVTTVIRVIILTIGSYFAVELFTDNSATILSAAGASLLFDVVLVKVNKMLRAMQTQAVAAQAQAEVATVMSKKKR